LLDGSPTITQKSHLQENTEYCGGSDGSDGSLPNTFSIMTIIAKVMWTEPAQPSQPSLHFKFPLSRETHTDGSEPSKNHQEPSRNLHLNIRNNPIRSWQWSARHTRPKL